MTYTVLTVPVCVFCCVISTEFKSHDDAKRGKYNVRLNMEHHDSGYENLTLDKIDDIYEIDSGDDKITDGEEVEINLYPYHIEFGGNCGAAIIDKKWAITAGHCGGKPYIRYGSKYLDKGNLIVIKEKHIHPMWLLKEKEHRFDYDFQLLELVEPVQFNENVQPIKIGRNQDLTNGKFVAVTGWGYTKEHGKRSNVLRAVRLPIVPKSVCQNVPYDIYRGTLTPRMFCAGFAEGKKDACQGDSGSPAAADGRLLGIVSFGHGCGLPGAYGVYSNVAEVRDWIQNTTGLYLS